MSFSEMMESGRGPGVIGMLMALFVLLGFGVLFMFAFDEGLQGGERSIEAVIKQQTKEIGDIKGSISHGEKQLAQASSRQARAKELREMQREGQYREGRLEKLRSEIASANESIAGRIMELDNYKDGYRTIVRSKAKGETMNRLATPKGDIYENVTIREVTPIGIQIIHDAGHKRIAFEELSTELQERFQFDPKQKAEAIAREDARLREHEAAVSVVSAAESQQLAERKEREVGALRDKMIRDISIKQARMQSLNDEIEALEDALPKESLKGISSAPQMRRQLSNKRGQLRALQVEVSRMQSQLSQ